MNRILTLCILGFATAFANETFLINQQYSCINTHSIQQGQQINVNENEAKKNPFVFTIKEKQLISTDNVIFDFKMKKGPMSSYSNKHYMLLLTPGMQVGLVPKNAKGAVQFYFKCSEI